jgi:hypothetical protein
MRRQAAMTMVVAILLAGLAGCGDPLADELEGSGRQPYSDEDPPSAGAKEELDATEAFTQEVNRACFTELAKVDGRSFTSVEVYAEWGAVLRSAIDVILLTMGGLGAPPGDEETVTAIMQGLGEVSAYIASVSSPEGPSMDHQTAAMRFASIEGRMHNYGLVSCDLP